MQTLAALLNRRLSQLTEVRTDGELLKSFLADRDESAFAELVRRHGPLVWGACRRLLPDPADAEDAFQASFLVLVRRAKPLGEQTTVGPWLHRVAIWTARNIRRRNARMLARRVPLAEPGHANGHDAADLHADLDGALLALPEKYRTPLILCHLQGWSRRDAAVRLGCPEGTLSSLLSRGLTRLRMKLGSYDPARLLALAGAAVPSALASATVRAATATRLAAAGAVPASVSQLVEGVIQMFWVKKATAAMAGLVVVFGLGLGAGVSVQQVPVATAGKGPGSAVAAGAGEKPGKDSGVNAIDWFNRRMREGVPIEAAVGADPDQIKRLEEELSRLKERLAKSVDQESELRVRSSLLQQNLQKALRGSDKAEIERATAILKESVAEADQMTLNVRELQKLVASLENQLAAAKAAQPKPAPEKPDPNVPDNLKRQLEELRAQIEKNQFDSARLEAQREQLRAVQLSLIQKLKLLEKQQELARNPKLFPPAAALVVKKDSLLLTIGAKGMRWVFTVTEHDRDGKRTGTAQFDSAAPLGHYLAGAGKDAKVPKALRIAVAKEVQYADLQEILDLVKSVGMSVSSLQLSAAGQGDADALLVPWEQLVRDREQRDAARRDSEMLKQELERLKLEQERLKLKQNPDPAKP